SCQVFLTTSLSSFTYCSYTLPRVLHSFPTRRSSDLAAFGKKEVRTYEGEREDEAIYAKVKAAAYDKIYNIAKVGSAKQERSAAFDAVKEEVIALFTEEELLENADLVSKYFKKVNKDAVRNVTLDLGTRLDGRKTTE